MELPSCFSSACKTILSTQFIHLEVTSAPLKWCGQVISSSLCVCYLGVYLCLCVSVCLSPSLTLQVHAVDMAWHREKGNITQYNCMLAGPNAVAKWLIHGTCRPFAAQDPFNKIFIGDLPITLAQDTNPNTNQDFQKTRFLDSVICRCSVVSFGRKSHCGDLQ